MKKIRILIIGSIIVLPSLTWAGDDDPCGPTVRMAKQINLGQVKRLRAGETITATNLISSAAQGDYKAGNSIALLPGFHAERGSVFAAQVHPCDCNPVGVESNHLSLTAYPNPFIESTVIRYQLTDASPVSLTLLDEQGQLVKVLVSEANREAGVYEYTYRNSSLRESVYLYSLKTSNGVITKRLVKGH